MQRIKMKTIFVRRILTVAITCCLTTSCSSYPADNLPKPKGTIPMVIDPGTELFTDTSDKMLPIKPVPSSKDVKNSTQAKQETLTKDLCDRVGKSAIQYSKLAAEESGAPYIARILTAKLTADNRESVTSPALGEVAVQIECFVTVALSTGDRGTVTIYELLDSDGKTRVRWDNYKPL